MTFYNLLAAMVAAGLLVWLINRFSEKSGQQRTQKLLVHTVIEILKQGVIEVADTGQLIRVEKLQEAGLLLARQKHRDVLSLYPNIPEPVIAVDNSDPEAIVVRCTCGTLWEEIAFNGLLFVRSQ